MNFFALVRSPTLPFLTLLGAVAAVTVPPLIAFNVSPSATLLNQLASVGGWGLCLLLAAGHALPLRAALSATVWASWAFALLVAAAASSWAFGALPFSLAASSTGLLLIAWAVMLAAAAWALPAVGVSVDRRAASPPADSAFVAFAWAMLAAGLLSAVVALVQVFWPQLTGEGDLIARSGLPGRAVGNLRQPNHLASLLMWALIVCVPLIDSGRIRRWLGALLMAILTLAVVLTASRTGILGIVLLGLWAVFDRRLSKPVRMMLLAMPVIYAICWLGMAEWAKLTAHTFGGQVRLGEADLSASRFGIWANTAALIKANPWLGVGWGEFNFAWTLSPFPGRPIAFFDHAHNLPLQLLVELGVPLGTLVLGLGVAALVQAALRTWQVPGPTGVLARTAFVMVLMIGAHSQVEYPLWYAYFLLPAAFAWGHALGHVAPPPEDAHSVRRARRAQDAVSKLWPKGAGALMVVVSLVAAADYARVVVIFVPGNSTESLPQRVISGQRSVLFSHHADYAAATQSDDGTTPLATFDRVTHFLLDTRLMTSWARALAAHNDADRARYVAARLKEFRNPAAAEFFAPCDLPEAPTGAAASEPAAAADSLPVEALAASAPARPFQCEAPAGALRWTDFR